MYYFDTNALWKFYYGQKGGQQIRRLVCNSQQQILVSPLTVLEFIGVLAKYYRSKYIKRKDLHSIIKRMRRDVGRANTCRPFKIIEMPENVYRSSEQIILNFGCDKAIQTNDAIHLTIADQFYKKNELEITFVTSDNSLKIVAQKIGFVCYDPEKDPLP